MKNIKKLEKNRYSIITDNLDYCFLCGKPKIHLHEIIFGKNRVNSMIYGLVIPVCDKCHDRIHVDYKLDHKLKVLAQTKFEENYDKDFLSIFHRLYK